MRRVMVNDEVSFVGAFVRVDRVRLLRLPDRGMLAPAPVDRPAHVSDRRVGDRRGHRRADRPRWKPVDARLRTDGLYPGRLLPERLSVRLAVAVGRGVAYGVGSPPVRRSGDAIRRLAATAGGGTRADLH